jgi:hypothetical protein
MALEDLTTYTEVDSDSDITITSAKADFSTMQRAANSYVYKSFGANHFGDFEIEFELEITNIEDAALACVCIASDTPGTYQDQDDANDGLAAFVYRQSANFNIGILEGDDTFSLSVLGQQSSLALSYATFKRTGTTTTFTIYSNCNRTTEVDSVQATTNNNQFEYLHCLASRDSSGSAAITGYTQNFEEIIPVVEFTTDINASSLTTSIDLAGGIVYGTLADGAALDDTIDAAGGSQFVDITDGAALDDTIEAQGPVNANMGDQAGLDDSIVPSGTFNIGVVVRRGFRITSGAVWRQAMPLRIRPGWTIRLTG